MNFNASSFVRVGLFATVALVSLAAERSARADVVAAYVQGYGGLSNPQTEAGTTQTQGLSPALGAQAGVRLLGLELYGDYTSFGQGASVERGILGLRLGFDFTGARLELRVGGGAIAERGGALTGSLDSSQEQAGTVARAGVGLEHKIAKTLLAGVAINGEVFSMQAPGTVLQTGAWKTGSDVFASLHLKFEVGI